MPSENTTVQSHHNRPQDNDPTLDKNAFEMFPLPTSQAVSLQASDSNASSRNGSVHTTFLHGARSTSGSVHSSRRGTDTEGEGSDQQPHTSFTAKPDATINSPESSKLDDASLEKLMAGLRHDIQQHKLEGSITARLARFAGMADLPPTAGHQSPEHTKDQLWENWPGLPDDRTVGPDPIPPSVHWSMLSVVASENENDPIFAARNRQPASHRDPLW